MDIMQISTHTPHARRDQLLLSNLKALQFQLTRLMRGVTYLRIVIVSYAVEFQLTRLMRGVTALPQFFPLGSVFQLTRLMRGVTPHL